MNISEMTPNEQNVFMSVQQRLFGKANAFGNTEQLKAAVENAKKEITDEYSFNITNIDREKALIEHLEQGGWRH